MNEEQRDEVVRYWWSEFSERIPHDALVVLLDKNDPAFNRENLRRVRSYLQQDDVPARAVVTILVGRLALVRSRLEVTV